MAGKARDVANVSTRLQPPCRPRVGMICGVCSHINVRVHINRILIDTFNELVLARFGGPGEGVARVVDRLAPGQALAFGEERSANVKNVAEPIRYRPLL